MAQSPSPVTSRDGLLVVRRVDWWAEYPRAAVRRPPALALNPGQVLQRYRGFDGDPWPPRRQGAPVPLVGGLAPLAAYARIVAYVAEVAHGHRCDLLYLQRDPAAAAPALPVGFRRLGYDCGYYTSESAVYSVLFHEVVFGHHPELRAFAPALNGQLLLPAVADVERVRRVREQLLAAPRAAIETSGGFSPILVYGPPTAPHVT
jgi:hypothetical protein